MPPSRRTQVYLPSILFLFFWLLYQFTAVRAFSYDGLCYALDVEFAPPANLFHPNHLLYTFVSYGLWRFFHALGYAGRAIYLMQSVNAFVAAGAVICFYGTLRRRMAEIPAAAGAVLFGVSHAFWSEAVDPGCYAWAALATVLLMELLLRPEIGAFRAGLAHGVLTLFHQMLILVVPAFAIEYAADFGFYAVGLAVGAGLPYALIAAFYHGSSFRDALFWALGPAGPPPGVAIMSHYWWSTRLGADLAIWWGAFIESVTALPQETVIRWILEGLISAAAGWGIYKSLKDQPPNRQDRKPWLALWIWVLILNVFQFFFYPGALRYRILFLPPLIYLIAPPALPFKRTLLWVGSAGILFGLALLNFQNSIYPRMLSNVEADRAAWVRQELGPQDFFLFDGRGPDSIVNVYMAYFAPDRRARSLSGYLFEHSDGNLTSLMETLNGAQRAGGRIFVESAVLDAPELKAWKGRLNPLEWSIGPDGYRIARVRWAQAR